MSKEDIQIVAQNRRAYHDYQILETLEAGLILTGTEVKSLRQGKASIKESYAGDKGGKIWLFNANITEYLPAKQFNHPPKRPRQLLLHVKQIKRLIGAIRREGITLIPISLYFNERGIAKLSLGLAKGKKKADKRESIKQRDWARDKARILKQR